MILRRLGNKTNLANKIISHFPKHGIYIELFFGAGGLFFNKPKAKYSYLNDKDEDVFNLFMVMQNRKDDLLKEYEILPYDMALFNHWKVNKETDPIKKALRFLYLSNFGYLGKPDCLNIGTKNSLNNLYNNIIGYKPIDNIQFLNKDFRDVIKSIEFKSNDKNKAFIYSDPPYLGKTSNYNLKWTLQDTKDCFDVTFNSGIKAAMSEFNNEKIISIAKDMNLNIIPIVERQNLKNRNTEILITNYKTDSNLFSSHNL